MAEVDGTTVRDATGADVDDVLRFGERVVQPHYVPLIGAAAAASQHDTWWSAEHIGSAVDDGTLVVAEADRTVVGVAQRGRYEGEHVIYKLYVDPALRGRGLGPRLVDALEQQLPAGVERVWIEHFAANERAAAFYDREGFLVQRVDAGPTGDPALAVVWRARDRRREETA
ncbi:GNAT family N-acetyltransferase [Jannaschia sp. R86511]|uniref:GNAT family N-acetyltransferase n=1 Tax=Jannaschia sp. R86511 TaxID=3093853 RepID=UPI0036D3AACC